MRNLQVNKRCRETVRFPFAVWAVRSLVRMGGIGVKLLPCGEVGRGCVALGNDRHCKFVPALEEVGMGKWPANAQNHIEDHDKICRDAQMLSQPLKADQWENLVRLRPGSVENSRARGD